MEFRSPVTAPSRPAITIAGGMPAASCCVDQQGCDPLHPPVHAHVIDVDATLANRSSTSRMRGRSPRAGRPCLNAFNPFFLPFIAECSRNQADKGLQDDQIQTSGRVV